jgi:RNA polymerase sigma-70 factor (ECF subfamily)
VRGVADRADDSEITAWALAAGQGDADALAAFIRATQRDVHRFLSHLSGPADAEDLRQETYLRALGSLHRFAGEAPARTWLLSIARRAAADAVRRARRRPRTDGIETWEALGDNPMVVRGPAEGEILLRLLVAELDSDRQEAFVLTQVLDLSYAEAAEVCGCPIGTIRSRVARAREELVAALQTHPRRRHSGS